MGQKVNPISLRLETTNRGFDSCYYNHTHSTQLFVENLRLQLYLNNLLKQTGFSQGRVLISTFFRGCESNLFYFNPLYSRENKGKRFMIKGFRPISSSSIEKGKEKDVSSIKHSFPSFKVNFLERVLKREQEANSFPFPLTPEKVVSNPFSNLSFLFPSSNRSSFLKKGQNVDRKEFALQGVCFAEKREARSKTGEGLKTTTFPGREAVCLDVSKQLSLLVCLYQLVENKRFTVFSRGKQKESFFAGEKTGTHREKETSLDENQGKKGFFLKKQSWSSLSSLSSLSIGRQGGQEGQPGKKIKEVSFFFPSVPTFSDFFFGGVWYSQRNKGVLALQRRKEYKKGEVGDLLLVPFPLKEEKSWCPFGSTQPLIGEKPFLRKQNSFLTIRENKGANRGYLEQKLFKDTGLVFYLSFLRALNSTQSALFLCQDIVYYLEKRVSFQRIKTVLLEQVSRDTRIKGIRVTCSGRVGGKSKRAQRSKVETFKDGQTSLGVFSSKIDFHCENGLTGFGLVGVKVWICYP